MSRKQYIAIAQILNNHISTDDYTELVRKSIIQEMASYFKAQNSKFDKAKFVTACGSAF